MSNDLLKSIIGDIENKIDSVSLDASIENTGEVFYL
jgi:hypothetical protein